MSDEQSADRQFDQVNESLYRKGATDGLPVVPPTDDRVQEMLRGTDRPDDEVLGHLGNRDDPVSVRKVAVNGVMAGCLPTHLPILIAGTEALAAPESNSIAFSVSTTGWAYYWTVNGPVRNEVDIQCESGAYGPGFRANRTMGRALGLIYKNTTRIQPGEKDMATIGNPFKFSLFAGENEEENPWEPYHVSHGYDAEDSTITLAGPSIYLTWTPYRNTAEYILEGMVDHLSPYMAAGAGGKTVWQILCPYSAEQLDQAGFSKQDVKQYVCDNSYVPARLYSRGKYQDREIARADPLENAPSRQLQQISNPDALKLLTIGGPGTVNAIIGPSIGGPVTKTISFPEDWEALVEEYREDTDWYQAQSFYE